MLVGELETKNLIVVTVPIEYAKQLSTCELVQASRQTNLQGIAVTT